MDAMVCYRYGIRDAVVSRVTAGSGSQGLDGVFCFSLLKIGSGDENCERSPKILY